MNLDQELGVSLGAGGVGDGDSGLRVRAVESLEQLGSWECGWIELNPDSCNFPSSGPLAHTTGLSNPVFNTLTIDHWS
jgi:hypothetical protein